MTAHLSAYTQGRQSKDNKRQAIGEHADHERPRKKMKALLEEDDSFSDEQNTASSTGGVPVSDKFQFSSGEDFTINQDFARRFMHNKEREELQRLDEKYGSDGSSTDSEEEDDEGVLASEALDAQIQNTLEAIRRKDPRVYDEKAKFYIDSGGEEQDVLNRNVKKEKPMYLSDYHRKNLLEGNTNDGEAESSPTTYARQQDDLKNVIVKEMHAATNGDGKSKDDSSDGVQSDDGFLVRKLSALHQVATPEEVKEKQQGLNVEAADRDPETYLSNFMSARAWLPTNGSRFQPFESDDEEEERRAEAFEEAYNLRFEDPKTSNEKLLSHARDAAAKYSVRKEQMNPRKKARATKSAKKDMARQTREEEKAQLRKLKVVEAEEKINKIKEAAGLRGESIQEETWAAFLEEDWGGPRWEQEMKAHFGDKYYADKDAEVGAGGQSLGKRKSQKPKWNDDITINDLVPNFNESEKATADLFLTDDESKAGCTPVPDTADSGSDGMGPQKEVNPKRKAKRKRLEDEQRKVARKERQKIERLVNQHMDVDEALSDFGKKHAGHFRYRDTSPMAYGLTAHDILMASDGQLNQYAGLKKLAAFRDSDKKKKDKKHLSKKARLRQWRKDTFGDEQGPQKTLAEVLREGQGDVSKAGKGNHIGAKDGKKQRRDQKKVWK